MTTPEHRVLEVTPRHPRFLRKRLPWYIPLIWIAIWLFSLAFVVYSLFPALQQQLIPLP
jgi:hypothetical protein